MAIHVEVLAEIDRRQVAREADKLADQFETAGIDAGEKYGAGLGEGIEKASPRIQKALTGVEKAMARVEAIRAQRDAAKEAGDDDRVTASTERLRLANLDLADAYRAVGVASQAFRDQVERDTEASAKARLKAAADHRKSLEDEAAALQRAKDQVMGFGDTMAKFGRTAGLAAKGAAIYAAPEIIYKVISMASAMTGVLGTIPAVAGAAAVGMGTLNLGMQNFNDTIGDVRDPKKFAEGLAKLSPEAQQAALSIRNLMPEFDKLIRTTQDSLFNGTGPQMTKFLDDMLPKVQETTKGVAAEFNQMFIQGTNQLMTPETSAALTEFATNTVAAFRSLTPAIAPFAQAMGDLIGTGSDFLPEMARDITDIAESFANFISETRESGELGAWIQRGIDTTGELLSVIDDVAKAFESFADGGESQMQRMVTAIELVSQTVRLLNGDFAALEDMMPSLGQMVVNEFNKITDKINTVLKPMNWLLDKAGIPKIPEIPKGQYVGDNPFGDNGVFIGNEWRDKTKLNGRDAPARGDRIPLPLPAGGNPAGLGRGGLGDPGTAWFFDPYKLPKEKGPNGRAISERDRRDAAGMALDPSLYAVTPGDSMGYPGQATQDRLEGERNVEDKRHELEEARRDRIVLERDNTATAKEIEDAKWKEQEAQWAFQKSQADLIEKTRGTAKDLQKGMDSLGAALDPDFGLSKGLAGLAENLVKFLGNIAAAPFFAEQQAKINADPIKGGYGLLGIRGAQNIAAGTSPLLGNPMPGDPTMATTGGATAPSGYTGGTSGGFAGLLGGGLGVPQVAGNVGAFTPASTSNLTAGPQMPGGYGLPSSTNTGGYGSGGQGIFPDWVQKLGAMFNVKPSTYAGHQDTDRAEAGYAPNPGHQNRGIDWTGTPQDMQKFADYLKNVPGMEQVIWNGAGIGTGDTVEIAGGRSQPGYFRDDLAGHGNHVHTRQSSPIPLPMPLGLFGSGAASVAGVPTAADPVSMLGGMGGGSIRDGFATGPALGGGGGLFGGGELAPPKSMIPGPGTTNSGGLPLPPGMSAAGPLLGGAFGLGNDPASAPPTGGAGRGATNQPSNAGATNNQGGNGQGIGLTPGGTLDTALNVAASAFPGVGQAAQTGVKLASRAIQYGGQVAGIATQGLMDTFLPTGGSELASNSWFTRILGGLAGATPAIPNSAGQPGGQDSANAQPPLTPEQAISQHATNGQGNPGPGNNLTINTNQPAEGQKIANDFQYHTGQSYSGGQPQGSR